MQTKLESKMYSIHQLETIAILLDEKSSDENVFLCSRCLSEKILMKHNVGWISEVEQIIKETKAKEYQQQKKTIMQYSEMFSNLYVQIFSYQEQVNGCISKLLAQIQQRQKEIEQSLEALIQPTDDNIEQQDFIKFIQLNERKQIFQDLEIGIKIENDQEFCEVIQNQFSNFFSKESYQGIIKQLEDIKSFQNIEAPIQKFKVDHQDQDSQKTLSLHFLCKKHKKEIIIINLEQETNFDRLCCIDCLSQFQKVPLSLNEANQKWLAYQAKVWESESVFQKKRNEKQLIYKKILDVYKKSHEQIMEQIFLSFKLQGKNIASALSELEQKNNFSSLFELEIDHIYKAVNQLSQTNDMEQVLNNQTIINSSDISFYDQILEQFKAIDLINYRIQEQLNLNFPQNQKLRKSLKYIDISFFVQQSSNLEEEIFSIVIPSLINEQQNIQLVWKNILDLATEILEKKKKNKSIDGELNQNKQILNFKLFGELYQKLSQKGSFKEVTTQTTVDHINGISKRYHFRLIKLITILKFKITNLDFHNPQSINLFFQGIILRGLYQIHHQDNYVIVYLIGQFQKMELLQFNLKFYNVKRYFLEFVQQTRQIRIFFYFLYSNNFVFSHHDKETNYKQLGITYSTNDVVTVEVNQRLKQITWKVNDQQCSLDIQTSSDIYFSCCMNGKNEVEIN